MRNSYANRRDENEREIIDALEQIGCDVIQLDEFDLLVGYRGINHMLEVKTATGKPTESQIKLGANWRGAPLHFVRTIDQAIAVVTKGGD